MNEGFYINAETIITAGAVLSALTGFVLIGWKLFSWIQKQKRQSEEIERIEKKFDKKLEDLEKKHDADIKEVKQMHMKDQGGIQEELTLLVYSVLACLKGLQEQGCDGPVSAAVEKLEKHLNQKAHGQE